MFELLKARPTSLLCGLVALFLIVLASPRARAEGFQLHARTGILNAMLGGAPTFESFMVMPILDAEVELLTDSKKSHLVHATFASDMATAQTKYFYAGYGRRYYVWGTSGARVKLADSQTIIESNSKRRYYYNWEVGIGQAQAQVVGLSLNVTSTVFEGGAGAGVIHQVTKDFGIVAHGGFGYGYGFSSVAVTGMFIRLLIGSTYYF